MLFTSTCTKLNLDVLRLALGRSVGCERAAGGNIQKHGMTSEKRLIREYTSSSLLTRLAMQRLA